MTDRYPTVLRGTSGLGRWARVAALGRLAGQAWIRGDAARCEAALDRQRGIAYGHPAAEVTALTSSALLTAASGRPGRARQDLAEAERRLHEAAIAALAPQWEQAALVCEWIAGDREAARARTARLETPPPPVPAAVTLGLRAEVLREAGRLDAARRLAGRLDAASPAALASWALAGLDAEPAVALGRLRTATTAAWHEGHHGLIPLLLHRTARIAAEAGEPEIAAEAHAGFAHLTHTGPLTRALAALTEARATRSFEAAHRAQHLAESAGLGGLTRDCLRVREHLGDRPARRRTVRDRDVPQALTPREREVAALVRDGRTNRQIAAALNLSVKSVEAYLTRVYAKTSCASRLELALALTEGRVDAGV